MPFDPITYVPPPTPRSPRLSPAGERTILLLISLFVLSLLVLPFSIGTFADILRYVGG